MGIRCAIAALHRWQQGCTRTPLQACSNGCLACCCLAGCPLNDCHPAAWQMTNTLLLAPQHSTLKLLMALTQGCSVPGSLLLARGMLNLGQQLYSLPGQDPAYRRLAAEVGRWLREAADAGCFSDPDDSPLGSMAVDQSLCMVTCCCKAPPWQTAWQSGIISSSVLDLATLRVVCPAPEVHL
jgi:hypothetical protein